MVTGVVRPPPTRMSTGLEAGCGCSDRAARHTSFGMWGNSLRNFAGTVGTSSRKEYPRRLGSFASAQTGFSRCSYPVMRPWIRWADAVRGNAATPRAAPRTQRRRRKRETDRRCIRRATLARLRAFNEPISATRRELRSPFTGGFTPPMWEIGGRAGQPSGRPPKGKFPLRASGRGPRCRSGCSRSGSDRLGLLEVHARRVGIDGRASERGSHERGSHERPGHVLPLVLGLHPERHGRLVPRGQLEHHVEMSSEVRQGHVHLGGELAGRCLTGGIHFGDDLIDTTHGGREVARLNRLGAKIDDKKNKKTRGQGRLVLAS